MTRRACIVCAPSCAALTRACRQSLLPPFFRLAVPVPFRHSQALTQSGPPPPLAWLRRWKRTAARRIGREWEDERDLQTFFGRLRRILFRFFFCAVAHWVAIAGRLLSCFAQVSALLCTLSRCFSVRAVDLSRYCPSAGSTSRIFLRRHFLLPSRNSGSVFSRGDGSPTFSRTSFRGPRRYRCSELSVRLFVASRLSFSFSRDAVARDQPDTSFFRVGSEMPL